MAQIVKRATIKQDGLYVTKADGDVHPLSFSVEKHEGALESFVEALLDERMLAQPAAKCNKVHLGEMLVALQGIRGTLAPSASPVKDILYGVDGVRMLHGALAQIGALWLSAGAISDIGDAEKEALHAIDKAVRAAYAQKEGAVSLLPTDAGNAGALGTAPELPEPMAAFVKAEAERQTDASLQTQRQGGGPKSKRGEALTAVADGKADVSEIPAPSRPMVSEASVCVLPLDGEAAFSAGLGDGESDMVGRKGAPCHGATTGRTGLLVLLPGFDGRPRATRYGGGLRGLLDALLGGAVSPEPGARLDKIPMADLVQAMQRVRRAEGHMAAIDAAEGWVREGAILGGEAKDAPTHGFFEASLQDLAAGGQQWLRQEAARAIPGGIREGGELKVTPVRVAPNGRIVVMAMAG